MGIPLLVALLVALAFAGAVAIYRSRTRRSPEAHWRFHADRQWMNSTLYPAVRAYFTTLDSPNALEIGCESYNEINPRLLQGYVKEHWFLDVKPIDMIPEVARTHFMQASMLEASTRYAEHRGRFVIVFSVGVLGFPNVDRHWTQRDISAYVQSAYDFLQPDGILFFQGISSRAADDASEYRARYLPAIQRKFRKCTIPGSSVPHYTQVQTPDVDAVYHLYLFCKKPAPHDRGQADGDALGRDDTSD